MTLNLHQRPALEAGDPNRFALRLEFVPNLDPGFAAPEEDLSWGRLQIWAGGANLCEHVDRVLDNKKPRFYGDYRKPASPIPNLKARLES